MTTTDDDATRQPASPGVMVSRWPVVDAELRVAGYRVDYAVLGEANPVPQSEAAAQRLFDDALSVVAPDTLVGANIAHLPISRDLLLALGVPPVPPDQVLLRLTQSDAREPGVMAALERLVGRGFALELGTEPGRKIDLEQFPSFATVRIDLATWSKAEVELVLPSILEHRARAVAFNVSDYDEYEWARGLGFALFDGPFYAKPRPRGIRDFAVDAAALASLLTLQSSGADVDESVRIIERDVGLSIKLLRYLNSAYLARRATVSSIRQAVMMLGTQGVARWALLIALTTGADTPRELSTIALTRARLCQSLSWEAGADPEQLFTIGLLSLADALLGVPLETALDELPLTEQTRDALLHHDGVPGAILGAVLSHERGEFDLPRLRAESATMLDRYCDALRWADSTVGAVS